jgi:phosphoribosyl 1,2-cyclic phosphodiesterase
MRVWILGSGSKGNAVLLECGATRVLVDSGFSARRLAERLRCIAVDPASIHALVLTHEHSDHLSGVARAVRRWGWPVHATAGTVRGAGDALAGASVHVVAPGIAFTVGSLTLDPVRTSHDANEPVAVVATSARSGMRAAIVTDTGVATPEVRESMRHADLLVVEANHDESMLQTGPYPWHLKRRVASDRGHLSNRAACELVATSVHSGLQQVVLAHLSETNNTPDVALAAMRGALRRARFRGTVAAARQHGVIGPFGDGAGVGGQLSLL